MAESKNHFDPGHLIGHVKDADYFEVPRAFDRIDFLNVVDIEHGAGHIKLFQPVESKEWSYQVATGFEALDTTIEPLDFHVTKFMVLEVVAAVIVGFIFIRLAKKISTGERPQGRAWNFFEAMLLFIRDEVVRPSIGHDADKFLPLIWTTFFFVLGCNLLGMVPWMGSPTGAFAVTGVLALIMFITVIGAGMAKMGPVGFWVGQVPHMELPAVLAIFLKPMIFAIEVMGLFIKHFVLAVRLLANMFAGHTVLAVLLVFIAAAWDAPWGLGKWGVMPASVLAATALSMLELFVAFLQAYIFAFLASLFIGMAVHPH